MSATFSRNKKINLTRQKRLFNLKKWDVFREKKAELVALR